MIRFGVIWTSWITDRLIEASQQLSDFTLNAVYSRTYEKAEQFSRKYGVSNVYVTLEELAMSEEIDAVYVASPISLHEEHA